MPQNREVAGATMGADGRTRAATFGPFGYLSLAAPVALAALFLPAAAFGVTDPVGLQWSWLLVLVVVLSATSRFAGRRGAVTDARWRLGTRNLAYWTQKSATWVLLGLLLVAFVGYVAHAQVFVSVVIAFVCGVTVGLAPSYFQEPPAALPNSGPGDESTEVWRC